MGEIRENPPNPRHPRSNYALSGQRLTSNKNLKHHKSNPISLR